MGPQFVNSTGNLLYNEIGRTRTLGLLGSTLQDQWRLGGGRPSSPAEWAVPPLGAILTADYRNGAPVAQHSAWGLKRTALLAGSVHIPADMVPRT